MIPLGRSSPFTLHGAWWRSDGLDRLSAARVAAQETGRRGLLEGFAADEEEFPLGVDEAHPCFATLEFAPTSTPRLQLRGASGTVFTTGDHEFFALHGVSSTGVDCSLLDCFAGNITGTFPRGQTSIELIGHLLVHGAHVTSESELCFTRAEVGVSNLREMVSEPVPDADGTLRSGLVAPTAEERLTMPLPGATVSIVLGQLTETGKYTKRTERTASLQFELDDPLSYREWLDRWIQPTLNFVRFATGRPARLTRFEAVLSDDELENGVWPGVMQRRDVEFCEAHTSLLRDDSSRYRGPLFGTAAFGASFGAVLERWFRLEQQLGEVAGLLVAVLQSRGYLDAQLVTLASVAEAYHRATVADAPFDEATHERAVNAVSAALRDKSAREHYARRLRFANSFSQAERIQQVIARAGTIVEPLSRKGGRLAERIVQTRNVLVHMPVGDEPPLRGHDLAEASRLLVLALEANLLLDLEIAPQHAKVLIAHAYNAQATWGRLVRRGHAWPK
jgi:hypothetical protein